MGETTGITWCDHTMNFWTGCVKVSPGCERCYAIDWGKRFGTEWGPKAIRKRTSDSNWKNPSKWNRKAESSEIRRKVFCCSLADFFEENPQITTWREDALSIIQKCHSLDWLLLTKRPENVVPQIEMAIGEAAEEFFWENSHVWIGFTGENQQWFDKRWAHASQIPAEVIFVSIEPMIGPVVLPGDFLARGNNVWVICGGESGKDTRPMDVQWACDLRDQCVNAGVPFFFKQYGAIGGDQTLHHGGDFLDGQQWHQFPHIDR